MNSRWKTLLWLLLAVGVVLGAWRAISARRAVQVAQQQSLAQRAQPLVELAASDVVRAELRELQRGLPVSGSLKAVNSAVVKARTAGELQGLTLREGDPVRAGQVVARIDPAEGRARLDQAQQQADAARAQIDIADRQYASNKALVDQGFISRSALDTSANNLSAAQATHKAALAAVDLARKGLDDTVLRAPISGMVAQRLAQPGERVPVDGRVLEIVDLSRLELEATLSAADSVAVRVGQEATLQVEGSDRPLAARVARINPSAQAGSRSVLAYLAIADTSGLRQGLFAQGTVATGRNSALAVPLSAVRTDKPAPYVQVVENNAVAHRAVETGARGVAGQESWVAVNGLQPGAVVIRGHVGPLREGTVVKFTAEVPPPQPSPRGEGANPRVPLPSPFPMWFTRVSLKNPVFATMVMLAIVVLGVFAYQRLKVDQFPNIDFPVVVVTADYPGASPEVVESEVSKKIEEAVNSIAGINALTSRSFEGQAVVVLEFQLYVDGRKAAEDVREKIAAIRPTFRDEVKEPRVLRFDPASRPIWSLAVLPDAAKGARPLTPVELTNWADQVLKKRLENVRGVGSVALVGGTKRELNIYLDPVAMESLGITADQVVSAVRNDSQDLPVGAIRSLVQERVVQVDARMQRPEDFGRIIVARRNNAPVRVDQVARVADGAQEVESLALYNGQRTLLLQVQKSQDENTIAVIDGLVAALADLQAQLPAGVKLEPVTDAGRPIRTSVDNVRRTLIEGALLTVLIVFLFLNSWRSTVITGLTLPIALIGTFLFMYAFGFSINMVTLMALSLCVGLLIDDAIVVRENIVRHVQMGKPAYQAALDGTQEIGLAVLATTFSIVAVFLPIGFMGGIIGKFFHEFGVTIVAAVLISMFVSFTLDPMLSSVWHDPQAEGKAGAGLYDRTIGRVTGWFDRGTESLASGYQTILAWALRHKLATVLGSIAIFATSVVMVPLLGTEFVPKADYSETSINFYTPVGSSLELTEAKARQVEAIVRQFPEVRYTVSTINTALAGKIYASVYVRLVDRKQRTRSVDQMAAVLRQRLKTVPGITVTHAGLLDAVGGNKQIEFSLQGQDLRELERLSRLVSDRIRDVPGLVDLDSSVKPEKPTISIAVKREAASDLGLSVGQIAGALRTLVAGQTVANWRAPDDQTYDVNVRLAPNARTAPQDLERLPFALGSNADGSSRIVRLNQVASVRESTGPNQINRRDLLREVAINANAYGRSAGEISDDIRARLDTIAFPPGYRYQFSGSTKNMKESFGYAVSALAMAVIFIYMILASQFRSFLQPMALMTSLPLTLIGVVLALLMFGSTLSIFSVIGIVMLMGLVTKNAILLVDFAIRMREQGMERSQALLHAARVRLRPILMTTLAMIFGMVPLAFALSEGAEQRAPMGQAVIGGVITSSLLTLVVVPVVYCLLDDLARWLRRGRRPVPTGAGAASVPASKMDGLS